MNDTEIAYLFHQPGQSALQIVAPSIATHPADAKLLVGQDARFEVMPANPFGVNYQWYKGAQLISGETNPVLFLPVVDRVNAGFYSVLLSNSQGAIASRNATLRVLVPQRLHSLSLIGGNTFRLVFGDFHGGLLSVEDFAGMRIEYSTDLKRASNWVAIPMPEIRLVGGQAHLDVTPPIDSQFRFYRVIQD